MALSYTQYLAATGKKPTAAAALQWLQTQAPAGTPIPAALRAHFDGATATGVQAAATPVPAATTAPAPAPASLAPTLPPLVNPNQPALDLLVRQMLTMPAAFNPQRQQLAAQFAASMAPYSDQPLPSNMPGFDPRTGAADYTTVAGRSPSGDIQYGIVSGGDGRLYRQAFQSVQHGSASRGVFSGSQVDQQQDQARAALNSQVAQAWANFQAQQNQLNQNEVGQLGTMQQNYAQLLGQGNQSVNDLAASMGFPPQTTGAPATPAATPAAPATAPLPTVRAATSTAGKAVSGAMPGLAGGITSAALAASAPKPVVMPAQQSPLRQVSGGVSPQRQAGVQPRPTRRTALPRGSWGGQWR